MTDTPPPAQSPPHDDHSTADDSPVARIPPVEWALALVGALLLVATLSVLVYEAVAGDPSPPAIVVVVESVEPSDAGWRVRLRVHNTGGTAATNVEVEGTLTEGETTLETSTVTVDHLASNAEARVGLFFLHEPDAPGITLQVRALSYRQP